MAPLGLPCFEQSFTISLLHDCWSQALRHEGGEVFDSHRQAISTLKPTVLRGHQQEYRCCRGCRRWSPRHPERESSQRRGHHTHRQWTRFMAREAAGSAKQSSKLVPFARYSSIIRKGRKLTISLRKSLVRPAKSWDHIVDHLARSPHHYSTPTIPDCSCMTSYVRALSVKSWHNARDADPSPHI